MTIHDLYLMSPEISIVAVALAAILLDLTPVKKEHLGSFVLIGLFVPFGFTLTHITNGTDEIGVFGAFVVDGFSLYFKVLFLGILALVLLASRDYLSKIERLQGEYYALLLLSSLGMMLLASTRELMTIYISLEMTALPLAALSAFLLDRRSGESGIKFLLLSAISSAVLLYGMALVYGLTGSTYLEDIAAAISRDASSTGGFGEGILMTGIILIIAGFGFKISSVPFQMWVPDVYQGAPTPVTAFLSVASKAAGFAIVLRVFYVAFPIIELDWTMLFAVLATLSMTVGNLVAMAQSNVKRLLAYSTIAHAGYLMVGVASVSQLDQSSELLGPAGVLFYLAGYAVTNLAAFFVVIAIANKTESEEIQDFAGMGQMAPGLSFILAIALVSLIGIPPTAGFMAKLYIFNAAINSGLVWLVLVGVINSVISAYYYLRVIRTMYMLPPSSDVVVTPTLALKIAAILAAVSILALGILPGPLLQIAEKAVSVLAIR